MAGHRPAQAEDRNDAGVLQVSSNLGFEQETVLEFLVLRVSELDLLKSDLSVQFLVLGDEHLT